MPAKCIKCIPIFHAGVQWMGEKLIDGSRETTKRLQELGKKVYFVTNAPVKSRLDLQRSFMNRGYNITKDRIISSSYVVAKYLHDQQFDKKVYLLGSLGISKELNEFGIRYIDTNLEAIQIDELFHIITHGIELDPEVGAVVVGFDLNFCYPKLLAACNYLRDPKCLFLATSYNERYPTKNGTIIPGIAPFIQPIQVASGRQPTILGKPNPMMWKAFLDDGTIVPERTLMIGDSAKYDILFGSKCGFQTLLVGTGVNSLNDVHAWQMSNRDEDKNFIPDVYLPKLGDLLPFMA